MFTNKKKASFFNEPIQSLFSMFPPPFFVEEEDWQMPIDQTPLRMEQASGITLFHCRSVIQFFNFIAIVSLAQVKKEIRSVLQLYSLYNVRKFKNQR